MHFDTLFLQFFTRRVQAKRRDPGIHQSPGMMDCRIKSSNDAVQEHHRTIRDAALELTRYQRAGAICIDPEPARAVFINSKPHCEVRRRGSEPVKRHRRMLRLERQGCPKRAVR
jgi:hypothetical protein